MSNYNEDGATPRFTVGAVLSQSFKVFSKHPASFLGVMFVFYVSLMILSGPTSGLPAAGFVTPLLTTTISIIAQGSVSYAVFQSLAGQSVSIGRSALYAASRIFQLLMISAISFILIGLGAALLIVPGLILFCMWAVVVPACVVEKLGVRASFSRSESLTEGHRLRIMGIILIDIAVSIAAAFASESILNLFLADPGALLVSSLGFLALSLPVALINIMTAVMYYRLRAVKEGVAIESLSFVFD